MSNDDYRPLADREREPESRIHQKLTKKARERLATITDEWGKRRGPTSKDEAYKHNALKETMKLVGRGPVRSHYDAEGDFSARDFHYEFIHNGDTLNVLTYFEQLAIEKDGYELGQNTAEYLRNEFGPASDYYSDIYHVLVTEGLLWDIEWAGKGGVLQFIKIESEAMEEIDNQIQAYTEEEPWSDALQGYNNAFDRYLNGDFDEQIPKQLYHSIEEILKTICVDLEGWTDNRELKHSEYLDLLKENGFYQAHGATAAELGDFLDSLERMVAKISDDRKQRHAYHDRSYATLLIHQIGAYLYFLISRYDNFHR